LRFRVERLGESFGHDLLIYSFSATLILQTKQSTQLPPLTTTTSHKPNFHAFVSLSLSLAESPTILTDLSSFHGASKPNLVQQLLVPSSDVIISISVGSYSVLFISLIRR
jgi:hypothetical protein